MMTSGVRARAVPFAAAALTLGAAALAGLGALFWADGPESRAVLVGVAVLALLGGALGWASGRVGGAAFEERRDGEEARLREGVDRLLEAFEALVAGESAFEPPREIVDPGRWSRLVRELEALRAGREQARLCDVLLEASTTFSRTSEELSALGRQLAEAARSGSTNVQSLAAAVEELSASIGEISRNAQTAAEVVRRSVREGEEVMAAVRATREAADKIVGVVDSIQAITEQTTILALNATIEAARAGEAGRGFAVVAQEVKALASQTSQAAETIREHLVAVGEVVNQVQGKVEVILRTIGESDTAATAIASAVEEQNAVVSDLSRTIQGVAQAAEHLSEAVSGAGDGDARSLQTVIAQLEEEAGRLRDTLDRTEKERRAA